MHPGFLSLALSSNRKTRAGADCVQGGRGEAGRQGGRQRQGGYKAGGHKPGRDRQGILRWQPCAAQGKNKVRLSLPHWALAEHGAVKRSQATENGGEAFDFVRWWSSLFSGDSTSQRAGSLLLHLLTRPPIRCTVPYQHCPSTSSSGAWHVLSRRRRPRIGSLAEQIHIPVRPCVFQVPTDQQFEV